MKKLITLLLSVFGLSSQVVSDEPVSLALDYDKMVLLDAENLAEQGIMEAYAELKSELARYIEAPSQIEEILDNDTPSYQVSFQGENYDIYGPSLEENEGQSWGRATYIFFHIVNLQLQSSDVRFYALYGGNDLGGLFLTNAQYEAAVKSIPRKTDWPYMPKLEHPWYGQPN